MGEFSSMNAVFPCVYFCVKMLRGDEPAPREKILRRAGLALRKKILGKKIPRKKILG